MTDLKIPKEYMDQLEFYQKCVNKHMYMDTDYYQEQRYCAEFGLDAFSAFYYSALAGEPCPCREPARLSQLLAASKGVNSLVESTAWDLLSESLSTKDFDSWRRNNEIPEWLTTAIYNRKRELKGL